MMALNWSGFFQKGAIAQLVERVLCKHEVVGSIPSGSTKVAAARRRAIAEMNTGSVLAEWRGAVS